MKETHHGERERQTQWIGYWWLRHCSTYRRQLSLHCYLFFCLRAQFLCFLTVHFCSSCAHNCCAGLVVNKPVSAEGTEPVRHIQKSFPYEKILWGRQGSSLGISGDKNRPHKTIWSSQKSYNKCYMSLPLLKELQLWSFFGQLFWL